MANNEVGDGKLRVLLFIAFIAAGLVGNYFKYPIFLNIDFLFGSIFAMLALQFFGLGRGILAAAIIASYTYIIWSHPYAIVIMIAEVAVVGWLMGRRKMGMVLADTLYWIIIGMPLVYLFYHVAMNIPFSNTTIVMTKQAVNGITNALVARLIFTGYALRSRSSLTSYRDIVYNLLAFFVLCPTLIMLAISSRTDFAMTDFQIRTTLIQESQRAAQILSIWVENRKVAIVNLAEKAVSTSPQQMQPYLELAKKSDVNFMRVGLLDRKATTTAYFPLRDEQGHSNIGISAADRPYVPLLKQSLKPMLTEVLMGRVGIPKPRVFMLAPVVNQGKFGGYVIGVLDLEQVQDLLNKSTGQNDKLYSLIDKNNNVIMTNRTDQKIKAPFVRGNGTYTRLEAGISQWIPVVPGNISIMERWRKSYYVAETPIGNLAEWRLILEQPVAPFQKALYNEYADKLTLLFLILLGALALAGFLSRRAIATLEKLRLLSQDLPERLAKDIKETEWPESSILETNHLIHNFRVMAESLSEQFIETRVINESLEKRVEERTEKLRQLGDEKSIILENAGVGISFVQDRQQKWANATFGKIFGYKPEEMIGVSTSMCYPSQEDYDRFGKEAYPVLASGETFSKELEMRRSDGALFHARLTGKAVNRTNPSEGSIWILSDETERYELQAKLVEARNAAESANTAKSYFLANMSHEIRTPMNGVLGMTQLLEMTELTQEQREYVTSLKLSGKNLLSLINDILDLSKIEADKITVVPAEFSLNQCIKDLVLMQKSVIREKGLALDVNVDGSIPAILVGDQLRVKQILLNLLGNAVKFTEQGSISVSAHLLEQHDASVLVQIAVRDSGIGISPEALDNIFKPFMQEDVSITRRFGGTGLGLTISRRLAELMGGTISVESTLGTGSCFAITLPFAFTQNPDSAPGVVFGQAIRFRF